MRHLLLSLPLLTLAVFGKTSVATDYYVNASLGNDAWSGTLPDPQPINCNGTACTDGPKQSLAVSNQGELLPGDRVFLHCGQIWRDTLTVVNSGAVGAPIAFSSYGPGCTTALPVISGSERVYNWVPDTGQPNVYVAEVTDPVNQVFVDGQYLRLAQHPNTGYWLSDFDSGTELLPGCVDNMTTWPGSCFLGDSDLSSLNDLMGAGIHIRTRNWFIEDRTVTGFDQGAGKVFWDSDTNYSVRQGYGYYLDNKRWMLDAPGEWFQDQALGRLYVWLPDSADPNQRIIEASVRDNLFDASNISHIALENIAFVQAAQYGVYLSSVSDFLVDSITVSDSGKHGAKIKNNSFGILKNSVIQRSVHDGIEIKDSSGTAIIGNQVIDSGTVGSPKNSYAAIRATESDGVSILGNDITNAGYIGIRFKRNSVIQGNVIRNSCLVLDDCGAVYTWTNSDSNIPFDSVVDSNIIVDVIGNAEGQPANETLTAGVYLDGRSNGVSVTNNIIVNADRGIFLHANSHLLATNILFGNRKYQIGMTETGTPGTLYGNHTQNNILFPLSYQQDIVFMKSNSANIEFSTFGSNQYSLVHKNRVATESYVPTGIGRLVTEFDLLSWKVQREPDAEAIAPFAVAQSRLDPVNSTNTISNSAFSAGTSGWSKWPANSVKQWQSSCSWDGGCLKFYAPPDEKGLLTSNPLSLVQGKQYVAEFAIRGELVDQKIKVNVRRYESGNYEVVGLNDSIKVGGQWVYRRIIFSATHTLSTARLEFDTPAGGDIEIDDARFYEVDGNDPADDALILINESDSQEAIPCPDEGTPQALRCNEYISVSSEPVDWPLTIAALGAEIIIWAANPFQDSDFDTLADVDDNCPEVANSPQKDADQDGRGDSCDPFPADPLEWLDTDGDGIGNNADLDDDNDSLPDAEELILGTEPLLVDTDGDMASDGLEVSAGTDPLDPGSVAEVPDGDVNADGAVDVADLLICMRVLTGQYLPMSAEQDRLDIAPWINGIPVPDGKITAGDYVVLQRKVLGAANF